MFSRKLNLDPTLARKSVLLLGPRQTGKSTFLRHVYPNASYIDLLSSKFRRSLQAHPERLADIARASALTPQGTRLVIIDEVQKIPELFDEVHRLLEGDPSLRFLLSGSSARRLKADSVNLLGGRAKKVPFHPIVHPERGNALPLAVELQWGGLPSILNSSHRKDDLIDYFDLYLREEIKNEGVVRNLSAFSRFLELAATTNAQLVSYSALSQEIGVSSPTIKEYYQILEDTLIGNRVPSWRNSTRYQLAAAPKFFLFDLGVANGLLGRWNIEPATPEFGTAFEHLVFVEVRAALDILGHNDVKLYHWRTQVKDEVDLLLVTPDQRAISLEAKASRNVGTKHLKATRKLARDESLNLQRMLVICDEPIPRTTEDGIEILPIEHFLELLWSGQLLTVLD